MDKADEQRLFDSCRVLFGPGIDIGWDFLFYLQLSGVKRAFRRIALLTHPDRAVLRGDSNIKVKTDLFLESKNAYDHLLDFIRKRHALPPPGRPATRQGTSRKKRPDSRRERGKTRSRPPLYFYRGKLPHRRLLLGEFLFYSGLISWEVLIRAIVWQRRQRPRLGDIALQRGWITPPQARSVAAGKTPGIPIGEAFVRARLLSRRQVLILLWRQRHRQQVLGEYFISRRYLSRKRLEGLIEKNRLHNAAFFEPARY